MPGINLVIDQYTAKIRSNGTISLTKSNNAHACAIPYRMEDYSPLVSYCESAVRPEWRTNIADLLEQERNLVLQRQQLMSSYKAELALTLPPLVEQFYSENPELFI